MNAVAIQNAIKHYKDVQALKGIYLEVQQGQFFGLLGPNGAGKTTLIQSIVGLCRLTSGHIQVFGHDVVNDYREARRLIGYSPQEVNLERFFNIKKTLQYQAGFFGLSIKDQKERTARLLEQFGISDKANTQFFRLSGGMQKRALIAKALVSKPRLLILDEPTAGIDVQQRHELWDYLRQLNADGTTIILTTHYIDEAEALCEKVGIINLGEIKELGRPKDLIDKYCTPEVSIKTNNPVNPEVLSRIQDFQTKQDGNCILTKGLRAGIMTQQTLETILQQPGIRVDDITVNKGNLERVFLEVTGKNFTEININTAGAGHASPAPTNEQQ